MEQGTIVLTPFPFTDLSRSKLRPAVVVSRVKSDKSYVVVAFISSKVAAQPEDTDLLIRTNDKDFESTGLVKSSVIKADKLVTLEKSMFAGEIGGLSAKQLSELKGKLCLLFQI